MASLQDVVEQLTLLATDGINAATSPNATHATSAPRGPIDFATTTFKTLFSASALHELAIILLTGGLCQMAYMLLSSLWSGLTDMFFVTASFDVTDLSHLWIMHWLSEHPSWERMRNVQVIAIRTERDPVQVAYYPAVSQSYTLWYKYRWVKVTRVIQAIGNGSVTRETLKIRILTRDRGILAEILQNAEDSWTEAKKDQIGIFVPGRYEGTNEWQSLAMCCRRPLDSVILDPGIAELVVEDVQDFLSSKEWYAKRGIPFRRGYLLCGVPGSGKTSLIHSIAGKIGLNVYMVPLSRPGLDDTTLSELISALPTKCIALMEDIDVAFHHSLNREHPQASGFQTDSGSGNSSILTGSRVSLSGLLNALDGIGAQEGRVMFATTNRYNALDPALRRPGRMDLHIEFKLASRFQAGELFKRFYAPSFSTPLRTLWNGRATASEKVENRSADLDTSEDPLIDLTESRAPPPSLSTPSASLLSPSPPSPPSSSSELSFIEKSEDISNSLGPRSTYAGIAHGEHLPTLSHDQLNALATQFTLGVPERGLSMASLQGFLMMYKTRPFAAAADIESWAKKELEERKD